MRFLRILAFGLAAAIPLTPVSATVVLDVDNLESGGSSFQSAYAYSSIFEETVTGTILYQTFTVGQSGVLDSIQIWGGYSGSGVGELRLFPYGTASGTLHLDTASFDTPAGVVGLNTFDVSGFNFAVVAGQIFTFGFSPDGCVIPEQAVGCGNAISVAENSGYAGGEGYGFLNYPGGQSRYSGFDLSFRTFVDVPSGVPEPAAWAMMILGFGFVGGAMRLAKHRQKLTASHA